MQNTHLIEGGVGGVTGEDDEEEGGQHAGGGPDFVTSCGCECSTKWSDWMEVEVWRNLEEPAAASD